MAKNRTSFYSPRSNGRVPTNAIEMAIMEELTLYHKDIQRKVNAAGRKAIKKLVEKTQATAPIRTGAFAENITYTVKSNRLGDDEYIWGVNAPYHRLTHLLAHGHANADGSRTPGDPFLENALAEVLPEYQKEVTDARLSFFDGLL